MVSYSWTELARKLEDWIIEAPYGLYEKGYNAALKEILEEIPEENRDR